MPSFEDLPSEISQKIFALVLSRSREYNLMSDLGAPGIAPVGHSRHSVYRGHFYDKSINTWVPVVSEVALVRVSKTVSAEATAVLYTNNAFAFEHAGALKRFLTQIGNNKQYLRHITIGIGGHKNFNFRDAGTDHAFDMVKSATYLRSITFDFSLPDWVFSRYPPLEVWELVDKLAPLIGTLHASRKARNIVMGNILGLVRFQDPASLLPSGWRDISRLAGVPEDDSDDEADWDWEEEEKEEGSNRRSKGMLFKAALAARLGLTME